MSLGRFDKKKRCKLLVAEVSSQVTVRGVSWEVNHIQGSAGNLNIDQ